MDNVQNTADVLIWHRHKHLDFNQIITVSRPSKRVLYPSFEGETGHQQAEQSC
jgi:hypothetical protein